MEINLDTNKAFKVGSWIISIDTKNREQLLKSCFGWTNDHTDLLLQELNAQVNAESILGIELVRTGINKLMYAIVLFDKHRDFSHVAATIGLNLIS